MNNPVEEARNAVLREELRKALMRLVNIIDRLHANDNVVAELVRAGFSNELTAAVDKAVGILDATAC